MRKIPAVLALAILAAGGAPVLGSTDAPARFSLSAGTGLFRPGSAEVRSLYGSSNPPWHIRFAVRVDPHWYAFAGLRYLMAQGTTAAEGAVLDPQQYDIRLSLFSFRLGVGYAWSAGPWSFSGFGGFAFGFFRETWPGTEILTKGRADGWLAGAAVEYMMSRTFGLQIRAEFADLPVRQDGVIFASPPLGGWDAVLGLLIRF